MRARTIHTESRRARALLVVGSLMLAGCAGYQLEPLATNHPAHPEATTAPEPPPSQTLAYAPADIPSVQAVSPVAAAQHGEHQARQTEEGSSQTVVGEGEVVATVPNASQIVLEHDKIKGFMEAMTMGYRIDPPSLLTGLKAGDKIRFTIDVQKRTITAIEKLR
jgi:Cu(I)/Ag(I) efflux system periplasmic protein CusF